MGWETEVIRQCGQRDRRVNPNRSNRSSAYPLESFEPSRSRADFPGRPDGLGSPSYENISKAAESAWSGAWTGLAEQRLFIFLWSRFLVGSGIGQVVARLIRREVILFNAFRLDVVFIVVATRYDCHPEDQSEYPQQAPHE